MNVAFSNPWGFLALLGIPLLVLIYFLRRRAKVVTVSTLFLLKRTQRESKTGRKFEAFSNSLPFWFQVLAILLLTWLLVGPRYGRSRSIRQIAIVVDSSASMQPVKEKLQGAFSQALTQLQDDADEASWIVLDHDPRRPRIYQGNDAGVLMKRMEEWNPTDGAMDPTASLRIARSLVGPEGVVVYLTDHEGEELPQSGYRLSLGESKANCGFTGVTVEKEDGEFVWTAIIRNYGDIPQSREWTMETPGQKRSEPKPVRLAPRKLSVLKGKFPKGEDRFVLRLSGDAMTLDDAVPVVVNQPRVARLSVSGSGELQDLGARMVRGFAHLEAAEESSSADVLMRSMESGESFGSERSSIVFLEASGEERPVGKWLAEEHELTKGLNFQALSIRSLSEFRRVESDEVLLWLGSEPVIFLRRDPVSSAEQLVFAFSLSGSNAPRLPAVAVLLHRFCELVARETMTPHTAALETRQLLGDEIPAEAKIGDLKLTVTDLDGEVEEVKLKEGFRTVQRTPSEPVFLSLAYQGGPLLEASVAFADTREADLSGAAAVALPEVKASSIEKESREDQGWRLIALLLLLVMMASWYFLKPSKGAKIES